MDGIKNHTLLRILFFSSLFTIIVFILWSRNYIYPLTTNEIIAFEQAKTIDKATEIMIDWSIDNKLENAQKSIFIDYFFIILYSLLIFTACRFLSLITKKESLVKAGKVFSFLVIFAGVCDVIENICMQKILDGKFYKWAISVTYNLSSIKYFLVGLCIVFIVLCLGALIVKIKRDKNLIDMSTYF